LEVNTGQSGMALAIGENMKRKSCSAKTSTMTKIDMRNTMDFFCMLKACALIKRLKPGESVLILSNDRAFLSDLRRVHPDCEFKLTSTVHAFEDGGDYLFRVEKSNPTPKLSS
jgi:hypothetical protein